MFTVAAALGAGMFMAGAGSAYTLELKDIIIQFDTVYTSERTGERARQDKFWQRLQGVAGTIIWDGPGRNCPTNRVHSLVYKPGQHAGTSDCPKARRGTATVWEEESSTANYTTTLTVSGTVLTLNGKMTAQGSWTQQACHDRSSYTHTTAVTQALKIRVSGMTCQVLQYSEVIVEDLRWASRESSEIYTLTSRLAPKPNCRVLRRSEQPPTPPSTLGSLRLPNC